MKGDIKLIQLFPDDSFCLRVKEHLGKIDKCYSIEQNLSSVFNKLDQPLLTDRLILVNASIVEQELETLLELSIFNEIIYVYNDDAELLLLPSLNAFASQILPYDFSFPLLFSVISKYSFSSIKDDEIGSLFSSSFICFNARNLLFDYLNRENSRIYVVNCQNNYCFYNENFAADHQLALSPSISAVITQHDSFNSTSISSLTELNQRAIESGEPVKVDSHEMIFDSGSKRKVQIDLIPLKDRTDKTRFIIGSYQVLDVEDTTKLGLFPDGKLLQILMDNITDTIYFKDLEGRFIRINKAQARLIGVANTLDAIGKTDFDFFNIEHSKKAYADEQRIIKTAQPINSIEYIGTNCGEYRWMSASKVPVVNEAGEVIGTVGITRDIDKIVRVEHRLKEERDLLQLLIDNIPSPIYFKDTESKFTRVNLAQAKVLGANSVEDVLGKSDFDFYSKEDALEFYNDEQFIIEKRKPLLNKIEECNPPGEGLRWFSTTKIPIKNDEGELSGIVGVSHDITDQILVKKDLERAIEKAEVAITAKSNFLSNMSHEIRTPMNGVIGMAEVLNMTELDEEQKKMVGLIIRSGNNLLSIINDILDFSKIENGKLQIESTPIDVKSIVREVYEMFMFSAAEKKINFYCKIDANIPEIVIGDSLRLKQILINLISNAIKFTKEGEVVVEASFIGNSDDTHCIIFKVIDTGIGIGNEEKQYLFDAFTQADASSSRKYGGTGLGLAISSRLAEKMKGKLDVISEKGKGSTFFFDVCFKKMIFDDCDSI